MSSDPQRLQALFQKYLRDEGTPEEIEEFWRLFSELDVNDPVKQDLRELWYEPDNSEDNHSREWDTTLTRIHEQVADWERRQSLRLRRHRPLWRVAAVIAGLFMLGIIGYLLNFKDTEEPIAHIKTPHIIKDIAPGGNKAVLVLANGQTLFLDSMQEGQLTTQGNGKVIKVNKGLLAYRSDMKLNKKQNEIQYNMLKTPKGGKYQLVLSDGTKVWLNASSSIRFPTTFQGNERMVEITGEAYFEVTDNANMPFKVKNKGLEINVLGTSFNVNTYENEPVAKVTLLKGSVKVTQQITLKSKIIRPGQQIQVTKADDIVLLKNVNVDEVVAWKNNLFWFEDDDIYTVMRQLSRWYDIDVEIKGNIPQHFTGSMPRDLTVSGVFEVLKRTGKINFEIENKKVIVSP